MKRIFAFCYLLLVSQMAMAVNWVNTDIHTIDNSFTYYVDYDSIVLNKFQSNTERYYLSAWVKGQSNKPNIIRGTNIYFTEVQTYEHFDCINKKRDIDVGIWRNNGKVVYSEKLNPYIYSSQSWERVSPDSMSGLLLNFLCSQHSYQ